MSLALYVQLQACLATIYAARFNTRVDPMLVLISGMYRDTFQSERI